jgi:hypothetical protein
MLTNSFLGYYNAGMNTNSNSNSNSNTNYTNRRAVQRRVDERMRQATMKKMFFSAVKRGNIKKMDGLVKAGLDIRRLKVGKKPLVDVVYDMYFENRSLPLFHVIDFLHKKGIEPTEPLKELFSVINSPRHHVKRIPKKYFVILSKQIARLGRSGTVNGNSGGGINFNSSGIKEDMGFMLEVLGRESHYDAVSAILENLPRTPFMTSRCFRVPRTLRMATILFKYLPATMSRGCLVDAVAHIPYEASDDTRIKMIELYERHGNNIMTEKDGEGRNLAVLYYNPRLPQNGLKYYKYLFERGFSPNGVVYGRQSNWTVYNACIQTNLDRENGAATKLMLKYGLNPKGDQQRLNNSRGTYDPLYYAIDHSSLGDVKALLKAGATITDTHRRLALEYASDEVLRLIPPLNTPPKRIGLHQNGFSPVDPISLQPVPLNRAMVFAGNHVVTESRPGGATRQVPKALWVFDRNTVSNLRASNTRVHPFTRQQLDYDSLVPLQGRLGARDKKRYTQLYNRAKQNNS